MLYNRLDNGELERAVYIDPSNEAARAELLSRIPVLMDTRTEEAEDMAMQLETLREDHSAEIADIEDGIEQAELRANELQKELDRATDESNAAIDIARNERDQALRRVEQLTACGDLV